MYPSKMMGRDGGGYGNADGSSYTQQLQQQQQRNMYGGGGGVDGGKCVYPNIHRDDNGLLSKQNTCVRV